MNCVQFPVLVLTLDTQGSSSKFPTGSPGFPTCLMRIPALDLRGTRDRCCAQQPQGGDHDRRPPFPPVRTHEAFGKLREMRPKTTKQMVLAGEGDQRGKRERERGVGTAIIPEPKSNKEFKCNHRGPSPYCAEPQGRAHHPSVTIGTTWVAGNKRPGSQGISRGREVRSYRKGHQKKPQIKT